MRAAQELGQASGNEFAGQFAAGLLAAVLFVQVRLGQAANSCRRAIGGYLERHARPSPTLSRVSVKLGCVLYEWNDLEAAVAHLA
jgi:hypothetical protein